MKEPVDQAGHYAGGAAMARDVSRWAAPSDVLDLVDAYAHGREALQSGDPNTYCTMAGQQTPEHWGEGKRRDLEYWRRGAAAAMNKH